MAIDIRAWVYTDDLSNQFELGLAKYIGDQVNGVGTPLVGGASTTLVGVQPETVPRSLKPRTLTLINAAGKRRRIVAFDTGSDLWQGISRTINLQDGAGALSSYSVFSRTGERRRVRAPGV